MTPDDRHDLLEREGMMDDSLTARVDWAREKALAWLKSDARKRFEAWVKSTARVEK